MKQDIFNIAYQEGNLTIEISWFLVSIILLILILISIFRGNFYNWLGKGKVTIKLPAISVEKEIEKNYENLRIAHSIYIELITRKAALPFDEENDVIKEVYDSWYSMFGIVRNEIKKLPGKEIGESKPEKTRDLIVITSKVLNKGLRPHLTKHQARFRKWYAEALQKEEFQGKTPQEIQQNYDNYEELIKDLKKVNCLLIKYSEELENFIYELHTSS